MSRHRITSSSRSRAITLIAAAAFSVAAAASAAAATWPREPSGSPVSAAHATAADAGVAIPDRLTWPQASPQAVSLALRATRVHAGQADHAAAQGLEVQLADMRRAAAARAAAMTAQSQSAGQSQQASAAAAYAAAADSPEKIARAMLRSFGWPAGQFACLYPLWENESGWNVTAANPGTGAYGIPQAMPGAKMASAGPDWQADAATQIRWGLEYIKGLYGSPCGAWDHEQATGWY